MSQHHWQCSQSQRDDEVVEFVHSVYGCARACLCVCAAMYPLLLLPARRLLFEDLVPIPVGLKGLLAQVRYCLGASCCYILDVFQLAGVPHGSWSWCVWSRDRQGGAAGEQCAQCIGCPSP